MLLTKSSATPAILLSASSALLAIASCLFFMALVGVVSYVKTRGEAASKDGYFLAGHGLSAPFIAGSLLLTNLSAEQMIGLNGSAYGANLSSMAWEVTAAFATILMALYFLPRYLAGAFTTLPEFLSARFDDDVRRMTAVLFMAGYGLVTIPSVLYSGSVAVMQIFDVPAATGLDYFPALVLTIVATGVVGAIYAIFGGLRAVAVSDTLNGVGLLAIGILTPVLGLAALGAGDPGAGLQKLMAEHPDKLNAIGAPSDPTPFGTIFTGMIFANLFYWCTNQYVIQRTLGAASLAEGQKGVLFAGYFKLLVPFMMMIPGVIAFHLYGPGLERVDQAYPRLIRDHMPVYLTGFFLAVFLGAVFSSFNSLLNSAATLFTLDLYAPLQKKKMSDAALIRNAKQVGVAIALFSFAAAPMLHFAEEGLWQVVRVFTGFYNIPMIAIVLVGLLTKKTPAIGAKIVIVFHVVAYGLLRFVFDDVVTLHFLHQYAILFAIEVTIMLAAGAARPRLATTAPAPANTVDLAPWRFAAPCAATLFSGVITLYLLFSDFGVASGRGLSAGFLSAIGVIAAANIVIWIVAARRQTRPNA
ncbi:MAG: solute:sodium symporter family transporter [Pseudomonadota bacterium]